MKNLTEFINEARLRIRELPFNLELFKNFINDAIIDGEYDDSKFWEPMERVVTSAYNEQVWEVFRGWCESYIICKI